MDEPFPILLVEDDEVDIEAFQRARRTMSFNNPLFIANDGIDALTLLRGGAADAPSQPCLIILDLNLPGMNGLELLRVLRSDNILRRNPVFVLTTSGRPSDIWEAYAQKASGYFLKEDFGAFMELVERYCRINKTIPEHGTPPL